MSTITGLASTSPAVPFLSPLEATIAVVAPRKELRDRLTDALVDDGLAAVHRGWDLAELVLEHGDAPDVVVVACEAPERRATLAPIGERFPAAAVVVVVPHATHQTVWKVFEAGAAGLVLEEAIERSLAVAVRSACAGQLTAPFELSVGLQKPILTNREKQILGMVVMGFRNAEIAGRLFLAESTIKSHLSSVFSKLGVRSRKEAVALVLDPDTGLGTGILSISDDYAEPAA